MNTGIGDAINLAWKLQTVLEGRAPDALLDSYEAERIAFARRLVKTTDRVFTLATAEGKLARLIRTRVIPLVLPAVANLHGWRKWLFRTVSQVMINYRGSILSEGTAGHVHGGDRLPWVRFENADNYASLSTIAWQIHVYGTVSQALAEWCKEHELPLRVFPWRPEYADAGLAQSALYLLRPDSYVALADELGRVEVLQAYFSKRRILPRSLTDGVRFG